MRHWLKTSTLREIHQLLLSDRVAYERTAISKGKNRIRLKRAESMSVFSDICHLYPLLTSEVRFEPSDLLII